MMLSQNSSYTSADPAEQSTAATARCATVYPLLSPPEQYMTSSMKRLIRLAAPLAVSVSFLYLA